MSTISPTNSSIDFLGDQPLRIVLRPLLRLDEEQFFQLVTQNPEQPLEQNVQGEVIVMAPTGGSSGQQSGEIFYQVAAWNKQHRRGVVFDSSTLFRLPRGSARSPDTAWVEKSRWASLTEQEQDRFPPLCPDFVIELRSRTDRLIDLQAKLVEYMENGAQIGWLVDPLLSQVHIYEAGKPTIVLDHPTTVLGSGCIEGLSLNLTEIFPDLK